MIRKDQLPDIWGDDFLIESSGTAHCTEPHVWNVYGEGEANSRPNKILLFNEEYRDMLRVGSIENCMAESDDHDALRLVLHEGAEAELYRLQIMAWKRATNLEVTMMAGSRLRLCTVVLGAEHVRNNIVVRMQGEGCELEAGGLYLMDRDQQCDNYIFVEHAVPRCTSHVLYKGIVDDAARARFSGHVLVQDGATKTEALMTNRNILLTDKAHVDTRPFLEIYNDDVKCSHGSTIGQLDEQALFYLQARGISRRTAVTMLSYAFCDEVIRGITVPTLRETVGDMVKKRLHGELSTPCDECAIPCSSPCNGEAASFPIDPSKL